MDVDAQCLLSTTWELQVTLLSAQDELSWTECELLRLNEVLNRTVKERDELKLKCQILQEQNHHHHHHHHQLLLKKHDNGATSTSSGSSEECESNTSSISIAAEQVRLPEAVKELIGDKPLPEKGRLLQAVMEAGPLLETFLISGPLPQWDHPPPNLNFIDIPLVSISTLINH